jgi:hypothetical protein
MKDAFQKEHEGEDENDWMIGPKGTKVMTPEALQRKSVRDRAVSEEVRQTSIPPIQLPSSYQILWVQVEWLTMTESTSSKSKSR